MGKRSYQPELIDLGPSHYTQEEYHHFLIQLDRIGRYLGGDQATLQAFAKLKKEPDSILDVGCGGGLFTLRLARKYPRAKVIGIDIAKDAIAMAQQHLQQQTPVLKNVEFHVPPTASLDYAPNSIDVLTTTLVCHHLSDEELAVFLKQADKISRQAVIINDLHRHPLAQGAFALAAPLFFRNRLIWHDGMLSIRRAFTRQDWIQLLKAAAIDLDRCSITWHWAFRWIVKIFK